MLTAVFLVPLIFFPFVSDSGVFEFSKQMVLYLLLGIMLFFWSLKMVLEEKVEIRRTVADPFILLFLIIYSFATLFSLSRWVSVFGDYPRLHGGLVSMFSYAFFYFVVVSHIKEKRQVTRALLAVLASAVLLSIAGMLHFFKVDIGIIDFREIVWLLIGPGEKAAMLLVIVFPVIFGLIFYLKKLPYKIALVIAAAILLGYLGFLNFYPALVVLALGCGCFLVFTKARAVRLHIPYLVFLFAIFVLVVSFSNFSFLKQNVPRFKDLSVQRELSLNSEISWVVILGGFNLPKNVFLGSGPGTYVNDFASFRPVELNNTPFWNLKFSRASNEIFQMISTVGILGFLAFLFPFFLSLRRVARELFIKKAGEETFILLGLVLGVVSGLVLLLFVTSVTATMFYLWLFLALVFSVLGVLRGGDFSRTVKLSLAAIPIVEGLVLDKTKRSEILTWIVFALTCVVLLALFLFEGKYFFADTYNKKGMSAQTAEEAVVNSARAVSLFPQNENYRAQKARIALSLALNLVSARQELSEDEQAGLRGLLVAARDEVNAAVSIAPFNSSSWEARGNVFLTLASSFNIKGAEDEALESYTNARQLAPTILLDPLNPRYPNLIGFIYLRFKDNLDLAQQNFFLAMSLKGDYAAASYNLAQVSKARGDNVYAETLISNIITAYDTLDAQQLFDLGLTKEQLEKEKDALLASSSEPEEEE